VNVGIAVIGAEVNAAGAAGLAVVRRLAFHWFSPV
jgi:hypothetical protein